MNQNPNINFSHLGVDVYTENLTIPTYKLGEPDPNPSFFAKGVRDVYPYSRIDSFTEEIEDKVYESVKLLSPWMEITILRDWGFHLYRAVDRVTGRDMFHCPKVMKPANNAIRGAYVAGGVEMNFPVGHNAMTYDRVGLYIKKTDEGVSALFHHIDRCSGMTMAAGVTLTRDFRGVMFDQFLSNPTPLPRPWYYWLNAGIAPDESLRFMFPNERMLGHFEGPYLETKKEYSYPIHEGCDYSKNMDIPEPVGLFSFGNVKGWFGAWYDAWNFGVVRWAPTWRAGGQKFWSWGNSEEGMLWGEIAADQPLPVPEIQSGRPEVQMDRGIMTPYSSSSHREWWMPVSSITDVTSASRFGAVNIMEEENSSLLKVSASQDLANCALLVNDSELIGDLELKVGDSREIPLNIAKSEITELKIRNSEGTLISWENESPRESSNILTLLDEPQPIEEMSAEAIFLRGFEFESMLRPDLALEFYKKCLEIDPDHSGAHLHLGLTSLMNNNVDVALREFKLALKSDRTNEEALYLHGLASLWDGNEKQALVDFSHTAATGREYVAPAIASLAIAAFRKGDFIEMDLLMSGGLTAAPRNTMLLKLKAILARFRKCPDEFKAVCDEIEKQLGVCYWLENEKELIDSTKNIYLPASSENEDALKIATAKSYWELDLRDEAIDFLELCKSATGQTESDYLSQWLGEKPANFAKTPFCAHGRITKEALLKATESNEKDAVASFSLGALLTNEGDLDAAVSFLREALALEKDNSLYLTTLGRVLAHLKKYEESVEFLERAIKALPANPLAWVLLDQVYGVLERRNQSWLDTFNSAPEGVKSNDDARAALAKLNADLGYYDEAERLLSEHVFHPYELCHKLRNLWSEIHRSNAIKLALDKQFEAAKLAIGKALEYPANFRLGKPLRTFDAPTLLLAALIHEDAGDLDSAKDFLVRSANEFQPDPAPCRAWSILAKIKLGETEKINSELKELSKAAETYLKSEFQPDFNEELKEVIDLCDKIRSGWMPSLCELEKGEL